MLIRKEYLARMRQDPCPAAPLRIIHIKFMALTMVIGTTQNIDNSNVPFDGGKLENDYVIVMPRFRRSRH